MSRRGPLEKVYDAEIAPLMKQIIAISKRARIPMHASFCLDDDLACTSHVVTDDMEPRENWVKPYDAIARSASRGPSPLVINTRDASGRIVRSEVVLG